MPDLTMCPGLLSQGTEFRLCKKRLYCHRYTAKPNDLEQSYFKEAPFDPSTNECEEYLANLEAKRHERDTVNKRRINARRHWEQDG